MFIEGEDLHDDRDGAGGLCELDDGVTGREGVYCREAKGLSGVGGGGARCGCCGVLKNSFGFGDDGDEGEQPDDLISDDEVGFGRGG